MSKLVCSVLVSTGLAVAALAQQPALRARELFYTPPPGEAPPAATKTTDATSASQPAAKKPAPARRTETKAQRPPSTGGSSSSAPATTNVARAAVPLAVRYSVLKEMGGAYREVDPESTFRSGDRIRLAVRSNDDAYLYVVMRGSSGAWSVLFPSKEYAGGDNHLKRGRDYLIPAGGKGQFVFDERPGEERLFLVLSRQPEADLDQLIYNLDKRRGEDSGSRQGLMLAENRPMNDTLIDKLRSELRSRDLVFEKVDATTPAVSPEAPANEFAIYVANPKATPEARLVADILLKHQ